MYRNLISFLLFAHENVKTYPQEQGTLAEIFHYCPDCLNSPKLQILKKIWPLNHLYDFWTLTN